jgi:hypothetical protein
MDSRLPARSATSLQAGAGMTEDKSKNDGIIHICINGLR